MSQGRLGAGYGEPVQVEAERAEEVESIQREEILQQEADQRRRQRMFVRVVTVQTVRMDDEVDLRGSTLLQRENQSRRRQEEV